MVCLTVATPAVIGLCLEDDGASSLVAAPAAAAAAQKVLHLLMLDGSGSAH
jgi:hypothetical protein